MSDKFMKDEDYRGEDAKGDMGQKRKTYIKKKVCRFCADKNAKLDYKEVDTLKRFITEGGKITPRRITGNCSKHQRMLAEQIKIARAIALLPYVKK